MVAAPELDQVHELGAVEDDRVEIDAGQRSAGSVLEHGPRVGPRPPHVIHARRVVGDVTSAVRGDQLELRKPLEDPVEDEVAQRDRGVERVADDVGEVVIR